MRTTNLLILLAAPLALAACDSSQDTAEMNDMTDTPMAEDGMMMDGQDMPMEPGDMMQTASAEGTVTAIDAEAGTITIDHGPVPAIDWPAMTMAFEADEQLRGDVSVGEGISFEFRTGPGGNVITSITKQQVMGRHWTNPVPSIMSQDDPKLPQNDDFNALESENAGSNNR